MSLHSTLLHYTHTHTHTHTPPKVHCRKDMGCLHILHVHRDQKHVLSECVHKIIHAVEVWVGSRVYIHVHTHTVEAKGRWMGGCVDKEEC